MMTAIQPPPHIGLPLFDVGQAATTPGPRFTWRDLAPKGVMLGIFGIIREALDADCQQDGYSIRLHSELDKEQVREIFAAAIEEVTHDLGELPIPLHPFIDDKLRNGGNMTVEIMGLSHYENAHQWEVPDTFDNDMIKARAAYYARNGQNPPTKTTTQRQRRHK